MLDYQTCHNSVFPGSKDEIEVINAGRGTQHGDTKSAPYMIIKIGLLSIFPSQAQAERLVSQIDIALMDARMRVEEALDTQMINRGMGTPAAGPFDCPKESCEAAKTS